MTENLEAAAGLPVDIGEAEKAASEDVVAQREEALASKLAFATSAVFVWRGR